MPAIVDDASIPDGLILYRLVDPALIKTNSSGQFVVSDGAFRSQEVSVLRSDLITQDEARALKPGFHLAKITAGEIRSAGCIIVSRPEPALPSHACIYRADLPGNRVSGGSAMRMSRAARIAP